MRCGICGRAPIEEHCFDCHQAHRRHWEHFASVDGTRGGGRHVIQARQILAALDQGMPYDRADVQLEESTP